MATAESATEATVTFPPFDPSTFPSQLFWFAIAFGVLYLFMTWVISPRLMSIVETRRHKREGDLSAASTAKQEAEAASVAYEDALSQAKSSAQATGQKAREESAALTDKRRKQLDADLAQKLQVAEVAITQRKADAMKHVDGIALETAKLVLNSLSADVAKSVSDDSIKQALKSL
jgi:F-type H+-transporting ATPase subunit b